LRLRTSYKSLRILAPSILNELTSVERSTNQQIFLIFLLNVNSDTFSPAILYFIWGFIMPCSLYDFCNTIGWHLLHKMKRSYRFLETMNDLLILANWRNRVSSGEQFLIREIFKTL